ncbi:MAG: heme ABC transporter ATP-binding protein [Pseudomonadota bacterium]
MNLSARNVDFRVAQHQILQDVSADFPAGQVSALIGPNGAGKSTLLRLLAADQPPTEGAILVGQQSLLQMSLSERARLRAVMTQSSQVVFDFTVADIIEFGWHGRQAHKEIALQEVIHSCALPSLLARKFNTLSGGEQQRVQFARALLQIWLPPGETLSRFLLLDEPTASLDVAHELQVLTMAREVARNGVGVIVVLHDLNLASRFADQLVLLHNGQVIQTGPPQEVLAEATLSEVYATALRVEHHAELDRLVIYS